MSGGVKHRKENETHRKCEELFRYIVSRCSEKVNEQRDGPVVGFAQDWGGNSLTVYDADRGHSHVGSVAEDGTFEELIDQLHDLLLKGRGLSFEGGADNKPGPQGNGG